MCLVVCEQYRTEPANTPAERDQRGKNSLTLRRRRGRFGEKIVWTDNPCSTVQRQKARKSDRDRCYPPGSRHARETGSASTPDDRYRESGRLADNHEQRQASSRGPEQLAKTMQRSFSLFETLNEPFHVMHLQDSGNQS